MKLTAEPAPYTVICEEFRLDGHTLTQGGVAIPKKAALSGSHHKPPMAKVIAVGESVNDPGRAFQIDEGDIVAFSLDEGHPMSLRDPNNQGRLLVFLPVTQIVAKVTGGFEG